MITFMTVVIRSELEMWNMKISLWHITFSVINLQISNHKSFQYITMKLDKIMQDINAK